MRKTIIALTTFTLALALLYFWNRKSHAPVTKVAAPTHHNTVSPTMITKAAVENSAPANIHPVVPKHRFVKYRPKKEVLRAPGQANPALRISKELVVAPNVYAVRQKDYRPDMGKIISTVRGMVFIESQVRIPEAANVVFDEARKKYYPINAVLKVRDADNARERLIAEGHQEYYYHEASKLLFLQSTHEKVLSLYSKLKGQGYEVSLEIIRSELTVR